MAGRYGASKVFHVFAVRHKACWTRLAGRRGRRWPIFGRLWPRLPRFRPALGGYTLSVSRVTRPTSTSGPQKQVFEKGATGG